MNEEYVVACSRYLCDIVYQREPEGIVSYDLSVLQYHMGSVGYIRGNILKPNIEHLREIHD